MEQFFVGFLVDLWGSFWRSFGVNGGSKLEAFFLEGIWKASLQDFGTVCCAFVAARRRMKAYELLRIHYCSGFFIREAPSQMQ